MTRSDVLAQISTQFAPYLRSHNELLEIRKQIASHIEGLQPRAGTSVDVLASSPIPAHVTGSRRRYLEELRTNLLAKQEYDLLRTRGESKPTTNLTINGSSSSNVLRVHLELLKLRKQQQKLKILLHYLDEAGSLAEQYYIFDTQIHTDPSTHAPIANERSAFDYTAIIARCEEVSRKLEVAVLHANHESKREQQLLRQAKSQATVGDGANSATILRALVATNAELARWIEDSLAKCDVEARHPDNPNTSTARGEHTGVEHAREIDDKYEQYLGARRRLLDATFDLTMPIPPTTDFESLSTGQLAANTVTFPQSRTEPLINTTILPHLESRHLQLLHQQQSLSQSQAHIHEMTSKHVQDLTEQLIRLSDESHLLPLYPILDKAKSRDDKTSEADRLIDAWKFAMGAAGTATAGAVEKEVRAGHKAVDATNVVLEAQDQLEAAWNDLKTT